MRKLVFWTFLAATLNACGSSGPSAKVDPEDSGSTLPLVESRHKPRSGTLADPDCQDQTSKTFSVASYFVRFWTLDRGTYSQDFDQVKPPLISRSSLASAAVKKTTFGASRVWECRNGQCGYFLESESLLRVCKNEFEYPRYSYEGVAITIAHHVNEALNTYEAWSGAHPKLEKVNLSVLPSFSRKQVALTSEGVKVEVKEWQVDNLAYFPQLQMIAAFPQSQLTQIDGYLWESPFVAHHEFGHHIEQTLAPYRTLASKSGGRNYMRKAQISVSEAFADLLATYGTTSQGNSLRQIPCLGDNRDPAKAEFRDQITGEKTPKILTQEILDQYKTDTPDKIYRCGEVHFFGSHLLGALIAYQADQLFDIGLDSTVPLTDRLAHKYLLSLTWIQEFRRLWNTQPNLKTIPESLAVAVRKKLRDAEDLSKACESIREGFPAIKWDCTQRLISNN